jgi:hypothetical protein
MPIMQANNNRVIADDPGPDDAFVQVVWFGLSEDGIHRNAFEGPVEPIENYEDTLAWAVEMAGQMAQPLYVVPMTGVEVLRTERMRQSVANLTDQQRGELRREVIALLVNVMRDSNDPTVRADAHSILVDMKVIKS